MDRRFLGLALLSLLAPSPCAVAQEPAVPVQEPRTLLEALSAGRAWIDLRYRVELVDQDSFEKDATASTLRTALGYESRPWHGLSGLLEFEDVTPIGRDNYNSTTNGVTDRPVVADPDNTEINQVYLQQIFWDDVRGRLGRQALYLDNERFVGEVAWRQNHQTLDALTLHKEFDGGQRLFYGYVENQNRVFGEESPTGDAPMSSHLFNAATELGSLGALVGYWYLLDYDRTVDAPFSSSTLGLRFTGRQDVTDTTRLRYTLEGAQQSDTGDNPSDYDATYWTAALGAEAYGVSLEWGFESLGSDDGAAFQTPLATLHKFNGWADKFLVTPPDGLEDVWFLLGTEVEELALALVYHDFSAEAAGDDYGIETDLQATYPISESCKVGAKFADYQADDFGDDTQKLWFWLSLSL
jgi:hypothetical protein